MKYCLNGCVNTEHAIVSLSIMLIVDPQTQTGTFLLARETILNLFTTLVATLKLQELSHPGGLRHPPSTILPPNAT